MSLLELFQMGGIGFMLLISILGITMFLFAVKGAIDVYVKKDYSGKSVNYILMFGSLALIFGILGQAIGMFSAFDAIQTAGDISPGLLAGGLRVSMIPPLYGAVFFILSIPIWMVLREKIKREK